MTRKLFFLATLALLTLAPGLAPALAQEGGSVAIQAPLGTAFTYQGQLKQGGNPVNANCDFQFGLWDAASGGTQIGSTQTATNVSVTNGLFTVPVDFGTGAFNGEARWLAISVRCPAGSGSYTALSPRQALTPAPYALALPGLYTQQNVTSPNLIGGHSGNSVTSGVVGATIGGGGTSGFTNRVTDNYGTVGGGANNQAGDNTGTTSTANYATVGGGYNNIASNDAATVGGGAGNTASNDAATVAGGRNNTASGLRATVGGGQNNTAGGDYATVGGGSGNSAAGDYSFVAGRRASNTDANHDGVFLFADSNNFDFPSTAANQFRVRATGGAQFVSAIDSSGNPNAGVQLAAGGGSWSSISDRTAKENFADVNSREVLARVAALPIQTWNYKSQDDAIRHIGPTAQDFYAAFGVGEDDKHITTIDADGVALAAIQGLYQVVQEKDAEIANLQSQNAKLEARLAALERGAGVARSSAFDLNVLGIVLLGALGGGLWLVRQRKGGR